jgi:hypothetical protein
MWDDQGDIIAAALDRLPKRGFSSTPWPGMMAGNDGVCPTSRGGLAPEQRPTAPTSAVALREDATPPAPCLTRPHGRAEGSASCFLGSRCRAVSLLNLPMPTRSRFSSP